MAKSVDFFVIGGGSGGVRAARIAANLGASVAVAEESRYGGTCVIRGCVPKKFFVYASEFGHALGDAAGYGWDLKGSFDWPTLVENKDARIDRLNSIYIEMLNKAGVEVLDGRATIKSANEIEINGERYTAKYILVATGGRPMLPEVPGAELGITSDEVFHLDVLPKHITIVGAGYIGVEFASIFRGLGVQVTLVHHRDFALRGFDHELREHVTKNLRKDGVELVFETEIKSMSTEGEGLHYVCQNGVQHHTDLIMFSIGRRPNTRDLGLEAAGVELGPRGGILIDQYGKTSVDSIYAVGDCTDRLQLTPIAIREGNAVANNLFGKGASDPAAKTDMNHPVVPTAIFTQPPAATVGLSEEEARLSHDLEIYRADFRPLYHSMTGRDVRVFMKLVVDKSSQKVLGLHMVGENAGDIVQAAAIAIGMGATKADFDSTVALHPSTAEELVLMRNPS